MDIIADIKIIAGASAGLAENDLCRVNRLMVNSILIRALRHKLDRDGVFLFRDEGSHGKVDLLLIQDFRRLESFAVVGRPETRDEMMYKEILMAAHYQDQTFHMPFLEYSAEGADHDETGVNLTLRSMTNQLRTATN